MEPLDTVIHENIEIINRISVYIGRLMQHFEEPNVNKSLAHFCQIHKLFILDNGCVDVVAIEAMSKLSRKSTVNHYLERECLITFQLKGRDREIGVRIDSTCSTTSIGLAQQHKRFLVAAMVNKQQTTTPSLLVALQPSVATASPTITPLSRPTLCARKPYCELTRQGKAKLLKEVKSQIINT